jgi:hypothetical protein
METLVRRINTILLTFVEIASSSALTLHGAYQARGWGGYYRISSKSEQQVRQDNTIVLCNCFNFKKLITTQKSL